MEELSNDYLIIIPISIIVALGIFLVANYLIVKTGRKYYKIDDEYHDELIELLQFEGWFTGYSLREDITRSHILSLITFTSVYVNVISYDLKTMMYQIFKTEKPQPPVDVYGFNEVRQSLAEFEKLNTNAVKRLKKFYAHIESGKSKNEK